MRSVSVLGIVGVLVVMEMMVRPPERAALHGRGGPEREEELADAGGAVGLVGEIAVVDAGNGEHPQKIEGNGGPNGEGAPAHPDHSEARQVENDERHHAHEVDLVGFRAHFFRTVGTIIRIDPLGERSGGAAEEFRVLHQRRSTKEESDGEASQADFRGKGRKFSEVNFAQSSSGRSHREFRGGKCRVLRQLIHLKQSDDVFVLGACEVVGDRRA